MKKMLTIACIAEMIHHDRQTLQAWISPYQPGDLCISAITMAELESAVLRSTDPIQNRLALILFLSQIDVLSFDAEAAKVYARMKQEAEQQKHSDPELTDGQIAAVTESDKESQQTQVVYDGSAGAERQLMIASHAASLGAELLQTMD